MAEEDGEKLPKVVLDGLARLYGIPLSNPYKRTHAPPSVMNRNKGLCETVQVIDLRENAQRQLRKDTSLSSVTRVDSCHPHPVGNASDSQSLTYEVSHPSSIPPTHLPSDLTPVSPLPPQFLPEESDGDEEVAAVEEEDERRRGREEKEKEAESHAVEFAAAQREEAERLLAEQSSVIGAQKSQADAILVKYA